MKTEKVFGGIILVGLIFKFMHWPFAGPLLVIGLGTLSMLYLAAGFYFFSDENIKRQNLALSIVSGFALSSACSGILFKLMFWPIGGALIMAVITVPTILAITFWLKSKTKRTDLTTYYNNMIVRSAVMTVLVAVFYFTSSVSLIKIIHSDDPEWVRLQTQSYLHPENEEYRKEYKEYINKK